MKKASKSQDANPTRQWLQKDAIVFWLTACMAFLLDKTAPSSSTLFYLLLANLCLGLPHGASDYLQLETLSQQWQKPLWHILIGYGLVIFAAIMAWLMLPTCTLLIFLFISSLHFGQDWDKRSILNSLLLGMGLLSMPILAHPKACQQIFAQLTFQQSDLAFVYPYLVLCTIIGFLSAMRQYFQRPWVSLEYLALAFLALQLSPLVFFTHYFCTLHSIRHVNRIYQADIASKRHIYPLSIVIISSILLAVICHQLLHNYIPATMTSLSTFRSLFILLFALTVPHMILTWNQYRSSTSFERPLQ